MCVWGGGGSRSIWHIIKKALTTFFFYFYFFSPKLILQKPSDLFQRKLLFAKVPVGVEHFSRGGGVQLYTGGGGGSNCFSLIETHITCDFPGVRTPAPRQCDSAHRGLIYLLVFFSFLVQYNLR